MLNISKIIKKEGTEKMAEEKAVTTVDEAEKARKRKNIKKFVLKTAVSFVTTVAGTFTGITLYDKWIERTVDVVKDVVE